MIFDDILEKIDALILKQPTIIKNSILSVEKEFISNSYDFDNNIAFSLSKIQKAHRIFKVDFADLVFKNENIDIKYSFEDYPLSFERALFFEKGDKQQVRVFSNYNLKQKKYNINTIDIIHKNEYNITEIFQYDFNKKKLKNYNEKSDTAIDKYQILLENENNPEIKDFLLLTYDFDIEKDPLCISFLETLHHFKKCINKNEIKAKLNF